MDWKIIMLECLVAFSVICLVLYMMMSAKKYKQKRNNPSKGDLLSIWPVELRYGDEEQEIWVNFYTDGLLFEKNSGRRIFIPAKDIKLLTDSREEERICYKIMFSVPDSDNNETIIILSETDLKLEFDKIIKKDKAEENNT